MKKAYIAPAILVVSVRIEKLMGPTMSVGEKVSNCEGASRGSSYWDDDEE